jgi:hypothetical protein
VTLMSAKCLGATRHTAERKDQEAATMNEPEHATIVLDDAASNARRVS